MPKDIRDILKEAQSNSRELKKGHRVRFEERLTELHTLKKRNYFFLKVAASVAIIFSIGYFSLFNKSDDIEQQTGTPQITNLSSISPEMKQIEDYYVTAINYEMASIESTSESKVILDAYLKKISDLSDAYAKLNSDLIEKGINEKTINALIDNLQLRLQILLELKDIINEMKASKSIENETTTI